MSFKSKIAGCGLALGEWMLVRGFGYGRGLDPAPVFIIGAPRSGTTLFCQVLVQRFGLGYITNKAARHVRGVVMATWLDRQARRGETRQPEDSFLSELGMTDGDDGPSEAGRFWYRWFPSGDDIYVPSGGLSEEKCRSMRRTIAAFTAVVGSPPVFKNTFNSLRIGPLAETFPKASFIVVDRDPIDVAQSLLLGRKRVHGTMERWLSVPVKEMDRVCRLSPVEQVVEQVCSTVKTIREDAAEAGVERFLSVRYEDLCSDPRQTTDRVRRFLARQGVAVQSGREIPKSFPFSTGQKLEDELFEELKTRMEEQWKSE